MTALEPGDPGARSGVKAVLSAAKAAERVIEHGRNLQAAVDDLRGFASHPDGPCDHCAGILAILERHGV